MLIDGYDTDKIKGKVRIRVSGRYRDGRVISVGRNSKSGGLMVLIRVADYDMPWGANFVQTGWYALGKVHKADRGEWKEAR
jgi:hypothetical protein